MSNTFTFPSIEKPSWRYRIFSSSTDNPADNWRRSQYSISNRVSTFDTYGDAEVQHSADCLVRTEDVVDFVGSFFQALDKIPTDGDSLPNFLNCFWPRCPYSDDQINFALSLKYNENKQTYYNLNDMKKSFSCEKRHDKRWVKLQRWDDDADVIGRAMYILTAGEELYGGILAFVAAVQRIAAIADPQSYGYSARTYIKRDPRSVLAGLDVTQMQNFLRDCESIEEFVNALSDIARIKHNAARRRECNEEAQTATASL